MNIEELIIQKITEYVQFNDRSANVMLINPNTFELFINELKEVYSLPFGNIDAGSLRYMGMKVCRTLDINPDCIEVY